jgi:hypothetical protein
MPPPLESALALARLLRLELLQHRLLAVSRKKASALQRALRMSNVAEASARATALDESSAVAGTALPKG